MAELACAVAVAQPRGDSGEPALLAHAALCGHAPSGAPLERFCFPEAAPWCGVARATQLAPSYYAFTLTDAAGARTFGHCLRFLPPCTSTATRHPAVLCVLSAHDWPALFRDLLAALSLDVGAALADSSAVPALLSDACPVLLKLRELCQLRLPPNVLLPRIASGPLDADDSGALPALLARVSPEALTALLAALLHERRVIVTGQELSDVAAAAHACSALLRPLRWQHLFLPVLPSSLLEYTAAPMPFIIGLSASQLAAVTRLKLPVEHLVVLNCDSGVIEGADADAAELPTALAAKLRASLAEARNGASAAAALGHFIGACVGAWEAHVHALDAAALPDGALRFGDRWFDHAAFVVAARSRGLARFRAGLRHSQLFEAFITERMAALELPVADAATSAQQHRVADMLSQARAGYRQLRDADAENCRPRASSSSLGWLMPRRPLGASNATVAAAAAPSPKKTVVLAEDRALLEAAVGVWQRHVSQPLREQALLAAKPGPQAAPADDDSPRTLEAALALIAQLRQEATTLRQERDKACAAAAVQGAEAASAEAALRAELAAVVQQREEACASLPSALDVSCCSSYEERVLRCERDMLRTQRDALLAERDELHAVLTAALRVEDGEHSPAVAEKIAPLQARLLAAATERDLLAAERDALRQQLQQQTARCACD